MTAKTTTKAKHVKTTEKYAGNQYGIIRKHSKVDRYYSVQLANGEFICEDWFMTLNGARLAAKLVNLGVTQQQMERIDCDSHAACANNLARWAKQTVEQYLDSKAESVKHMYVDVNATK